MPSFFAVLCALADALTFLEQAGTGRGTGRGTGTKPLIYKRDRQDRATLPPSYIEISLLTSTP
jgi:hypothetical protein